MAICPSCQEVLQAAPVACPHCGYDFTPGNLDPRRGIAYSPLADLALVVGIVAAGLGCIAALIASVVALMNGQWSTALVVGPLAFFLQLAMLDFHYGGPPKKNAGITGPMGFSPLPNAQTN
jgi:hypothetical protein